MTDFLRVDALIGGPPCPLTIPIEENSIKPLDILVGRLQEKSRDTSLHHSTASLELLLLDYIRSVATKLVEDKASLSEKERAELLVRVRDANFDWSAIPDELSADERLLKRLASHVRCAADLLPHSAGLKWFARVKDRWPLFVAFGGALAAFVMVLQACLPYLLAGCLLNNCLTFASQTRLLLSADIVQRGVIGAVLFVLLAVWGIRRRWLAEIGSVARRIKLPPPSINVCDWILLVATGALPIIAVAVIFFSSVHRTYAVVVAILLVALLMVVTYSRRERWQYRFNLKLNLGVPSGPVSQSTAKSRLMMLLSLGTIIDGLAALRFVQHAVYTLASLTGWSMVLFAFFLINSFRIEAAEVSAARLPRFGEEPGDDEKMAPPPSLRAQFQLLGALAWGSIALMLFLNVSAWLIPANRQFTVKAASPGAVDKVIGTYVGQIGERVLVVSRCRDLKGVLLSGVLNFIREDEILTEETPSSSPNPSECTSATSGAPNKPATAPKVTLGTAPLVGAQPITAQNDNGSASNFLVYIDREPSAPALSAAAEKLSQNLPAIALDARTLVHEVAKLRSHVGKTDANLLLKRISTQLETLTKSGQASLDRMEVDAQWKAKMTQWEILRSTLGRCEAHFAEGETGVRSLERSIGITSVPSIPSPTDRQNQCDEAAEKFATLTETLIDEMKKRVSPVIVRAVRRGLHRGAACDPRRLERAAPPPRG